MMESSAKELIAEIDAYLMVNYGIACWEAQSLLRRCRAALQEAAPVPREPTRLMRRAGVDAMGGWTNDKDAIVREIFITMYDAALQSGERDAVESQTSTTSGVSGSLGKD